MFHDAQRNILELNKSRLMALDELKQAKERINELGACSASQPCIRIQSASLLCSACTNIAKAKTL